MIEHIAPVVYYFGVHLLYASFVWAAAWALTTFVRGSATTKYWIWVATSLNFIVPLGALLDKAFASRISGARPLSFIGNFGVVVAENAVIVGAVWLLGALLMFLRLCLRLRSERREAHTQKTQGHDGFLIAGGVPVEIAGYRPPAVTGVLHARISLPEGIDRLLSTAELNAVLLHEVTHAKRRDNLIRLLHESALCLLWFHPLMWITGSRLALYREFSCDEHVIKNARGPDLVSALAKLADPEGAFLLQASAASFIGHRLARLAQPYPAGKRATANALLVVLFGVVVIAGVYATVAHTACCFIFKR